MFLFIDTSQRNKALISLLDQGGSEVRRKHMGNRADIERGIIPVVQAVLGRSKGKVRGIVVVSGPSVKSRGAGDAYYDEGWGFTSLRLGVVCANALGWMWKIPVVGVRKPLSCSQKEYEALKRRGALRAAKIKRWKRPVVPHYGKEPNITAPRAEAKRVHRQGARRSGGSSPL